MIEQEKREKVIEGLKLCGDAGKCAGKKCPYYDPCYGYAVELMRDALALLEAQEPRVMTLDEVIEQEPGTILWVEEAQGVVWNLFPLEIDVTSKHPDTGTHYLYFITYHDIKKFECVEYNQVWRCWTSRPTEAQRKAAPWRREAQTYA